ncbi:MAG TPA: GNAT family N-acetyltransferase [Gaiellaceae bacterium]|nr:GNAT family N-acetyltransferase [Gaiellaceae bacterium]
MIREATRADREVLHQLWREFGEEVKDAPWRDPDEDEELAEIDELVGKGVVLVAESEDAATGIAFGGMTGTRVAELRGLYVRPRARGAGIAAELVREFASRVRESGAEAIELDVVASNEDARAVYTRWGFEAFELRLAVQVADLEQRLEAPTGPTFGAVHVQTDDAEKVRRDATKFLRTEPDVETAGDWVRVRSDVTDAEPERLKALAKELSYTTGGVVLSLGVERGAVVRYDLFDRGSDVDEYLSVPEFYGPLPPGDAYALGSNPTVVARLTGADARRVRETARTAASAAELPPAQELYEQIARVMGVEP